MASKTSDKNIDELLQDFDSEVKKEKKTEKTQDAVDTPAAPVASVETAAARDFASKEEQRKKLVSVYREQEKIAVTISPFYAPYLGKVVRQSVNGIFVDVPADGKTYMINKTHASHILSKIRRIDQMLERQKRAGDISKNLEYAPGELHL